MFDSVQLDVWFGDWLIPFGVRLDVRFDSGSIQCMFEAVRFGCGSNEKFIR